MMKPFIPDDCVNVVVVDKNISESSKQIIRSFNIDIIESVENTNIDNSTATHPDMQFCPIDFNKAFVASFAYEYYSVKLPTYELLEIDNITYPYPYDSKINITTLDNSCVCTDYQWNLVGRFLNKRHIRINQGYSKCNICILNSKSVITSDFGIIRSLSASGINAYYLPDDEIGLKGYTHGFWGGCSGLLSSDKLFFNGDISKMDCYDELLSILKKEKIEPIFNKEHALYDCGSIIPVI